MKTTVSRRRFLRQTSTAAAGLWLAGCGQSSSPRRLSANEKLNLGVIGVANRGESNLIGVSSQNIVALCDVDANSLAQAASKFPAARQYRDFRRLLDQRDLDAVVVSTPDHTHAAATLGALRRGLHVYCEKPLARTIAEARLVSDTARQSGRATQLGTQIHAEKNYRRVVELIQANTIGPVREVHVWVAATYGGKERPTDRPPVPAYLDWDLWLGPVEFVPYHPAYAPGVWRNWWAFGGGALADFGCHYMDLPFWALDLRSPSSAEPLDGPPVHPDSTPPWMVVKYEFPARGEKPPVHLTWYHGGRHPAQLTKEQYEAYRSGVLFVGERGQLMADYVKRQLLPEKQFVDFKPPAPTIPDSLGHHMEWITACKTGGRALCDFAYGGPLTEAALLGNVAYRMGRKLEWNPEGMRASNCPEADALIRLTSRPGWKV